MDDIEAVQWFFDLDCVTSGFNWPIGAARLANSKRQLDAAVQSKSSASVVLDAYKALAAAIGPTAMTLLLQGDDAFPEVNHSGKPTPPAGGLVVLYVDATGKCVVAKCFNEYGKSPELSLA